MLIMRTLKKINVVNQVEIVRDGAEALDYVFKSGKYADRNSRDPAVILLDIKLPKVSGLEVLERVRADGRTKRLPVVMLTSSDEQEDMVKSYDLGCNSYVRKPVEFDKFTEAVSKLGLYWLLVNEPPPETA
ncbi:MAG: response regulator [Rhodospirillales bacterium]|nr:response regulator [Rhodospirillales bacterium]MBI2585457.1 response regulator [Rhodospirillales bacterium]